MSGREVGDGGTDPVDAVWQQPLPWQDYPLPLETDGDATELDEVPDPSAPVDPNLPKTVPPPSAALGTPPRHGTRIRMALILTTAAVAVVAVIVALGTGTSPAPGAHATIDSASRRPTILTTALPLPLLLPTATAPGSAPATESVPPTAPEPSSTAYPPDPGPVATARTPVTDYTPGTGTMPHTGQPSATHPAATSTTHPAAPHAPNPTPKPDPSPAPTSVEVSGQLSCDSGKAIVGVWVQAAQGSGFASWRGIGDGSTADYWIFLPAALPYAVHVGCGGTPSLWGQGTYSSVYGTTHNSFNCDDIKNTADYRVCVHR